jgi:tRNA(fMet)-specific endonuclease VapC
MAYLLDMSVAIHLPDGDVAVTDRIAALDDAAADAYGSIVAHSGYSRPKLIDRMIAAQALVHRATLVTFNADDFRDIPGLQLESW